MKTREEQRKKRVQVNMLAIGLWCQLRLLAQDALAGDQGALVEFQHYVQYAPAEMKEQLFSALENGSLRDQECVNGPQIESASNCNGAGTDDGLYAQLAARARGAS